MSFCNPFNDGLLDFCANSTASNGPHSGSGISNIGPHYHRKGM